jgi:type IX secretion system substrate protein
MNLFNPKVCGKRTITAFIAFFYLLSGSSFLVAQTTWTGSTNTDWNTAANWNNGIVPGMTTTVIIPNTATNFPVISTGVNAFAASLTVSSGASLTLDNTGNLTISNNGTFSNSGAFSATGSGAVIFTGKGTISGVTSFKNVTINGAVDFGTSSTITGTLLLNTGGAATGFSTHSIIYSSSSTLIYNETITTGNEWDSGGASTIAAGTGVPQNVVIQSGTVTIPNTGGTNRALAGNLTINPGASLKFAAGSRDLFIAGNWINNGGSFIANSRKVTFDAASGTQSVSGNTTFYDLTLDNTGATTDFTNSTIIINDEFRAKHGTMDGDASTFIFSGPSCTLEGASAKNFYNFQISAGSSVYDLTSSAGDTHIANTFANDGVFNQNSSHMVYFDKSSATESFTGSGAATFGKLVVGDGSGLSFGTTLNAHADFMVTGGSIMFHHGSVYNGNNNTATFSINPATVSGSGTAQFYNATTSVNLNFGNGISKIEHNLQIDTAGSIVSNAPFYSVSSTLIYNTTSTFSTGKEWSSNNVSAGLGVPQNVSITNSNSITLSADRTVPGTLSLTAGSLDINDKTLTVNGGFAGTGGYLKGSVSSNLVAGGTGTINFDPSANYLKDFTIKNPADLTLGNALNIAASNGVNTNTFGIVTANGTLISNGHLTIKSDKYGDGIVGQSAGTINGAVTVERYVYPRRAWRFLAVPVNSTETIRDAWQEGAIPNPDPWPENNPKPGFGTEITYGSENTALGFDENTSQSKPSCKYWDSTQNLWIPIPTTNMPINSHAAYCIFVRGSRAINLSQGTSATPDSTILRITGTLNQIIKTQSFIGVPVGNFVMMKNPYASPLTFTNIASKTNVNTVSFYVFDPKLNDGYGVGGYNTYNTQVPGSGWLFTNGSYPAGSPPVVQSGEAFFVATQSGIDGSLTYDETAKSLNEINITGKVTAPYDRSIIFAELLQPNDSMKLADKVAAIYGNKYQKHDSLFSAKKFWNDGENISIWDSLYYAISCRPVPTLTDTLFFRLYLVKGTPYALRVYGQYLKPELPARAWLIDNYLHIKTEINLYDSTLYSFAATDDTLTYRNRFLLVFNKQFVANRVPVTKVMNQSIPGISGIMNSIGVRASGVHIYPNPVSDDKVMLQFSNMAKGVYEITVYNSQAQKILNANYLYAGGDNTYCLSLSQSFASGLYSVVIVNEDSKKAINLKLVIDK